RDPRWSLALREAKKLAQADPDPAARRFSAALKRLHARVTYDAPEGDEVERARLAADLDALAADPALARHPGVARWQRFLCAHRAELLAPKASVEKGERRLDSAEISAIALEVSSMGSRLDKEQKLEAALGQLKEDDRILILMRQVEGGADGWRELTRAWNG